MSTRIRYSTSELGKALKKSNQVFRAGKKGFYVVLNEDSMHYMIFDAETKEPIASGGNTTNKTVLRLQAKKALEQLGVKFSGENRKKTARIVPKDEPLTQDESSHDEPQYVRRDEVFDMIEAKVKEILGIIDSVKNPSQPQRNEEFHNETMVG
jgi:hypothetical protein